MAILWAVGKVQTWSIPLRYYSYCTEAHRALRRRPGDFVWAWVKEKARSLGKTIYIYMCAYVYMYIFHIKMDIYIYRQIHRVYRVIMEKWKLLEYSGHILPIVELILSTNQVETAALRPCTVLRLEFAKPSDPRSVESKKTLRSCP